MDVGLLKATRIQRGLSVSDLSRATRLSPAIIAALEAGRFEALPAGIYARSFVRAYAEAVGLDVPTVLAAVAFALPAARLDLLELAELRHPTTRSRANRHATAAIVDAMVLCTLDATIVAVCAWVCSIPPVSLLLMAPGSVLLLCATPLALYFWLLGALDVRTVGPWLLDVEILPRARGPMQLSEWMRRGGAYIASEMKLACAWKRRQHIPS